MAAVGSAAGQTRLYFIGNSLSRGLSLASGQDRARLEALFAADDERLIFGTQLGAGVNLDEHWAKLRLSTGVALQLTHMDDAGETSESDGVTYGFSFFRDYQFAFQGKQRDADGTILTGQTFDGISLQPYQSLLEASHYTAADQAKGFRGDRAAIRDFIGYASGDGVTTPPDNPPFTAATPNSHRVTKRFYIYSAWPRLDGIESKALDADADGIFSFSEFYAAPYSVPVGGLASQFIGEMVPTRDYVSQLVTAVRADHPVEDIRLIPVGEVFAAVDVLIRTGQLPGIEAYFTRNAQYYLDARLDGFATLAEAGFTFLYPPGQPANFGSSFIAAQGVKNFYCDKVHMNDQTHNDERSGTIGAYLAAATVHAVVTGRNPNFASPSEVAAIYEQFDGTADAALIQKLQETVWSVVTADPRTGVVNLPADATAYAGFRSARFSSSQQADPVVSSEQADPDYDGLPNIAEFFLQSDPLTTTPQPLLTQMSFSENTTTVSVSGLARYRGLHPRIEASTDLATWSRLPIGESEQAPSGTPGLADYSAGFARGARREFYRLGFSYSPDRPLVTMVEWGPGGEIVAGNQNLIAGSGSASLSLTTPANPAVGAAYSATSPVFFSAASPLVSGNTIGAYRITNDTSGTADMLHVSFGRGTAAEIRGVFSCVWKQDGNGGTGGFLNGAATGNVTLGKLRLRAKTNSATTGVTQTRFIVCNAGQWLISGDCGAVTGTSLFETIRLPDPYAVAWFSFDPANHAVIGDPVVTPSFDHVTAVGFQWRAFATGSTQTLQIESFDAEKINPSFSTGGIGSARRLIKSRS